MMVQKQAPLNDAGFERRAGQRSQHPQQQWHRVLMSAQ